jgi:hypothetical protein
MSTASNRAVYKLLYTKVIGLKNKNLVGFFKGDISAISYHEIRGTQSINNVTAHDTDDCTPNVPNRTLFQVSI